MPPDKKSQRQKFEEAVRELGIDEADAAFEVAVEKVAKSPKLTDEEIKKLARKLRTERGK